MLFQNGNFHDLQKIKRLLKDPTELNLDILITADIAGELAQVSRARTPFLYLQRQDFVHFQRLSWSNPEQKALIR